VNVWYIVMRFPAPSETFVAAEVSALKRLGVDVSVHALLGPDRDAARLTKERGLEQLRVTHATAANLLRGVYALLAHPFRAARVAAWIVRESGGDPVHMIKGFALLPRILGLFAVLARERPDVVHIYWGHYPAIFGWLTLEYMPDVIVSLSLSAYDLLRGFRGSIAVARRAHVVSTWAGVNVAAIAERGIAPETVHVAWQGIDVENVRDRPFHKSPRRIVTAGRLVEEKGMDDVLRTFAKIVTKHPDATLLVLGDGPDRGRLETLVSSLGIGNAVVFRGHVGHHEVFEELATAEVFLFLSRYVGERLPNVVKEAMACCCLVVTTATPGIGELLTDGEHGWVVPCGDWEQAAERATRALDLPESARAIAAAAQRHVLEKFDLLVLMEQMMRRWQRCGAPGGGPSPSHSRSTLASLQQG
jgi:colanic acid/amylovoran biosynthesis glycosyltransferase